MPEGFTPIFNGKDLTGWHVSKTNHHGTTPDYRVLHGRIVGTQSPRGKGGILLTDKKYKNFEVSLEVNPDLGCDSGLFLRSTETGEAYQVLLDYLTGRDGRHLRRKTEGRDQRQCAGAGGEPDARAARRAGPHAGRGLAESLEARAWNSVRARIEGDVPQIKVWINDQLVTDFKDTANHAANGAPDGMIAIQMHFTDEKTNRWVTAASGAGA